MKNIAEQILEGLSKFYVGFQNRRVLKTMEEIEANTDEQNIPSALLLGEINNKLMFPDGSAFYLDIHDGIRGYNTEAARGADTFFPFNNSRMSGSARIYGKDSNRSLNLNWSGYTKLTYNCAVVTGASATVKFDSVVTSLSAADKKITDGEHNLVFSVPLGTDAVISYNIHN